MRNDEHTSPAFVCSKKFDTVHTVTVTKIDAQCAYDINGNLGSTILYIFPAQETVRGRSPEFSDGILSG